ncbi:MAG: sensor histidine kinase [Lachnospiraceae bacterium]|nr:sensor histidine kinase [Lachnospiraceae bacterium]
MEHMETYWGIVSYAYIVAEILLMGYMLYDFSKPFLEEKKRAFCIGIAYSFTMLILYVIPPVIRNFTAYSVGIFVAFLVMCAIDHRNYQQKVFLAITFFSLRWLGAYMTRMIATYVYNVVDSIYITEYPVIRFVVYVFTEIIDLMISFTIMKISVRCIVKSYVDKHESMSGKELFMLITPSVTGVIGYGMMQYYRDYCEESIVRPVFGIYAALAFLYYGISIVTIVVVTVMFQKVKKKQKEKLQNGLLAVQIESMKRHIEQVEELYQNVRSIKHDMANHILTLERLYARDETEEAQIYISDLKTSFREAAGEIKSGNPVTDVILREWENEAQKLGIDFQSDFYYPSNADINAFDLSVILNNALQNAMEHANGKEIPYVIVSSYCKNSAYIIEIRNSFMGELQWDARSRLPLTAKKVADGQGYGQVHGYGLSNIQRVARKYWGDIDVTLKEEEFCLTVLLMLESLGP